MSGKLLIVGDSFCTYYIEENRKHFNSGKNKPYIFEIKPYKYWFQYFADDLNLKVLNLSRCGAGNQQIFENAICALNTNKDIKTFMLGWSSLDRFDLPSNNENDYLTLRINDDLFESDPLGYTSKKFNDKKNKYVPLFREDDLFSIERQIDRFLNYSVTIDSLCKSKNIELVQFFTVHPLSRTLYLEKIGKENYYLKEYINNKLMNYVNTDNFFGFPGEPKIGGTNMENIIFSREDHQDLIINKETYTYSEEFDLDYYIDAHPNGEGNKLIYETLKNFRLDKLK